MQRILGSYTFVNTESLLWLLSLVVFATTPAHAVEWPQEITAEEGVIVVYQPQADSLEGNKLAARAAMSIEPSSGADPIFGAMWIEATIETDRSEDTAVISNLAVTNVTWPDSKDTQEQRFTQVVEDAVQGASFSISLTQLSSALAVSEQTRESLENLNTEPPNIVFADELSILLIYDGDPIFQKIENSPYERALNTPFAVASKGRDYYLTSGSLWYEASDPLGPWRHTTNPPSDLAAMVPKSEDRSPTAIPSIVTATDPTELIVTSGKPKWVPLEGGKILYVENTETAWLRDLASGNMYVQLSGRWFRSKSEEGPWTFVRPDKLPESFSQIPPASDIGGVRSSVAGTVEANEAIADASIPQTAAIKRDEAELSVEYDGKPEFEAISGTEVAYAVNTAAQVLSIDGAYYAVDDGVWFSAASAQGPWVVADTIPAEEISKIPPTSPVYNTTYVHIYDSTPEVVYVGYTPGYLWSYPYYGVPVYGTGWYYPPYYGGYYYPRTPTWGFNIGYNPWTGWTFGVSWGGPFFRVGISWGGGYGCCGGWYGGGYRHNDINIDTGDINIGNNVNIGNPDRDRVGSLGDNSKRNNLYNRPENKARNAPLARKDNGLQRARVNPNRANDVFADRSGQVARHRDNDWEVRQNNQWQKPKSLPETPFQNDRMSQGTDRFRDFDRNAMNQRSQHIDRSHLNRDRLARQRGSMRRRR